MSPISKIILVCSFLWTPCLQAQRISKCDSVIYRAHKKLASFYSPSASNPGYSFDITVSATYRDESIGKVAPQHYHMAFASGTFLFQSEQLESLQNDSVRISVIKTQNRIYIAEPDKQDASTEYMNQFNRVQLVLPQFMAVKSCKQIDGIIQVQTTVKADTMGLGEIEFMTYAIDRKSYRINSIEINFIETNPISTYRISYSDMVKPYVIPPAVAGRYIRMIENASNGKKEFDHYTLIDNRKKRNP